MAGSVNEALESLRYSGFHWPAHLFRILQSSSMFKSYDVENLQEPQETFSKLHGLTSTALPSDGENHRVPSACNREPQDTAQETKNILNPKPLR